MKEIFWEEDGVVILALPLHKGRENFIAWHFDNHGRFSMRSAYKVCCADILRERCRLGAQGGSRNAPDPIWKMIWQLSVPSKVKHFIWRMAHNSHPLRSNLVQQGMKIDYNCPICGEIGEDGGHLFLNAGWRRRFGVI